MADWVLATCKHTNGNIFGVSQEYSDALMQLYKLAGEVPNIQAIETGEGLIQFTHSSSQKCREKSLSGDSMLQFSSVEGESIGAGTCMALARCSRTFALIRDLNSLCCTSCGRHASTVSFEYEWLGSSHECGVCGCLCI